MRRAKLSHSRAATLPPATTASTIHHHRTPRVLRIFKLYAACKTTITQPGLDPIKAARKVKCLRSELQIPLGWDQQFGSSDPGSHIGSDLHFWEVGTVTITTGASKCRLTHTTRE
jgi:hypothetical protein